MIDTKIIFALLGPLFLMMAGFRTLRAGKLVPQAKTWLIIGIIFSAVAAWLWFAPGHP
jgi:surface polysaccharide O-acyltransferase-like enzyme